MRDYDVIGIEDTALTNMTRSAAGTMEEPGRNVKAKAGLNRSISEQNLGQLKNQLQYKAEWAGKKLVLVDPRNTTRTCSRCAALNDRPGPDRIYRCGVCELQIDQDANAAVNILHATQDAVGLEHDETLRLFEYGVPVITTETKKRGRARSQVVRLRVPHVQQLELLPAG